MPLDFFKEKSDNFYMSEKQDNELPGDGGKEGGGKPSPPDMVNVGLWTLDVPVAFFNLKMFTDFFDRIAAEEKDQKK